MRSKRQLFVSEYLVDRDARAAAVRAGYSPRSVKQALSKLLADPAVVAALEAAGAMPARRALVPRQERFVREYLVDLNGTAAAVRAGYSPRSAHKLAPCLLRRPPVAAAVAAAMAVRSAVAQLTARRVRAELLRLARADATQLVAWGPGGARLRPLHEMPAEHAAAIAHLALGGKNGAGLRLRLYDRTPPLRRLARILGLFDRNRSDRLAEAEAHRKGAIERVMAKIGRLREGLIADAARQAEAEAGTPAAPSAAEPDAAPPRPSPAAPADGATS